MDESEAQGILDEIVEHDTPAAAEAVLAIRAELDAARATIAEQAAEIQWLRAVVRSLHYRMTCCDPEPTRDEIVDTLARARDAAPTRKD